MVRKHEHPTCHGFGVHFVSGTDRVVDALGSESELYLDEQVME